MGNWNITINGVGAHGNGDSKTDADELVRGFVEALRACQTVTSATFTSGCPQDIEAPAEPEDEALPGTLMVAGTAHEQIGPGTILQEGDLFEATTSALSLQGSACPVVVNTGVRPNTPEAGN